MPRQRFGLQSQVPHQGIICLVNVVCVGHTSTLVSQNLVYVAFACRARSLAKECSVRANGLLRPLLLPPRTWIGPRLSSTRAPADERLPGPVDFFSHPLSWMKQQHISIGEAFSGLRRVSRVVYIRYDARLPNRSHYHASACMYRRVSWRCPPTVVVHE